MKEFECVKKYSYVRGFAYFAPKGSHGISNWIYDFEPESFRYGIVKGKEKFPAFNTVVISLSVDAWFADRVKFLENLNTAFEILKEENMMSIPRFFNSCFGTPAFGGYTAECVKAEMIPAYSAYVRDCLEVFKDKNILLYDISNEPLNNTYGSLSAQSTIKNFIAAMYDEIKKYDDRPCTIGTQGYFEEDANEMRQGWVGETTAFEPVTNDIEFFFDQLDVISLHPYNVTGMPQEEFEMFFSKKLEKLEKYGKPVLITESCWAAPDDEGRKLFLETELVTYKNCKIGFSCHTLNTSQVADTFPLDENSYIKKGLYMAFLDCNYEIRKYHEMYNELFPL